MSSLWNLEMRLNSLNFDLMGFSIYLSRIVLNSRSPLTGISPSLSVYTLFCRLDVVCILRVCRYCLIFIMTWVSLSYDRSALNQNSAFYCLLVRFKTTTGMCLLFIITVINLFCRFRHDQFHSLLSQTMLVIMSSCVYQNILVHTDISGLCGKFHFSVSDLLNWYVHLWNLSKCVISSLYWCIIWLKWKMY